MRDLLMEVLVMVAFIILVISLFGGFIGAVLYPLPPM